MIQLRDYQIEAVRLLRESARQHKRMILLLSTGAGKTSIASHIIHGAYQKNKSVLFLAHRKELITQAQRRLADNGVFSGMMMGPKSDVGYSVNVASVQTLVRRKEKPKADIIFIDECHHVSQSNSYDKILSCYPDAMVIGLTATATRLDGKPLKVIFDHIVNTISTQELIDQGYLTPIKYFGSKEHIDLEGVRTTAGDYNTKDLFNKFDKTYLYLGVVNNYNKFAPGTKAIVFNVNVMHSISTMNEFLKHGIACEHLDAETPDKERYEILERFKHGVTRVLCNVAILTEGFDLPDIETVILNRATKSEVLYLQMIGRGLRPSGDKQHCIVIDHGDNVIKHGFAEDTREYTLEGKKKKKKALDDVPPVKECPKCYALLPVFTKECKTIIQDPETKLYEPCGHIFKVEEKEMDLRSSEFGEIKRKPLPDHLRKQWKDCNDSELREIAQHRGYKIGWVYYQIKARKVYQNQLNG